MKKTNFLALSFLLALSGFATAYAQAPALASGTYKLTVGSKAPCALTISDTGTVNQAADCSTGTTLTKWKASGDSYVFTTASGEVFAVLKSQGDTLEGKSIPSEHKVVLSH